jgi:hypothetical protein
VRDRQRLLIISFSELVSDPRVRRQIALFQDAYEVISCGYGPAPDGVARHVELPLSENASIWDGRLLALRLYRIETWRNPGLTGAWRRLKGLRPDIVLANEVIAAPLALRLKPRLGIHVDLHEYHSRVRENEGYWRKRAKPWIEWMIRTSVVKAGSWTTVAPGIAAEYEREFGFRPGVVRNTTPYAALTPSPVSWPPRLVHSGAGMRKRGTELIVQGVLQATNGATLDLYLTKGDPDYLDQLGALAKASDGRVTLHDPVPYAQLIDVLNGYDVGIHVLPPVNFNHLMALPNKVFDYLQACLGVIVGPSPEMVELVEAVGYGVSTADFTPESIATAVDSLTPGQVEEMKAAAYTAAPIYASDAEDAVWSAAIERIGARRGR